MAMLTSVANNLLAKYPELNLNIVNTGVNGDTVRKLEARWERDCINHKPDILSVLIGINDLWRQYVEPERLPEAVYPDEYELTYRRLLLTAKKQCRCQIVLMEPFMFCNTPENPMFKGLQTYIETIHKLAEEFEAVIVPIETIHKLAEEFEAVIVPLQSKIDEQIKQVPPEKWSADSVHPYVWAHAWIAQRWLQATGL
ncbi:MAG: SGNH/GDSL hydrolase family protein [Planctomycetota bacterium]